MSLKKEHHRLNRHTWRPERNDDWIDTVIRRFIAHAAWDWVKQVHILRPEEPIHPVQHEVRASWHAPGHFDLASIVWTVWPDLNYIRFRLYELTSSYCVDSHRGLLTLLVRPSRWGITNTAKVIAVEVVRLQWSSVISRATAHLITRHFSPKQLAQHCRIRDCSVMPCEVRLAGEPVEPDEIIWPKK